MLLGQRLADTPMTTVGYHASHEQFAPSDLLEYVRLADEYGFSDVLASDHFHPWSERQGESGHVWSWLGAALATTDLTYGTVNAPGYRYHPAVIAQAAATHREMHPERFWLAVGSGQQLNEGITGEHWPVKRERNARLQECAEVMRRLWDGETVTHHGRITVEEATLYTRPETAPPLIGAAQSTATARWLGEWADGMITVGSVDPEEVAERVAAFRDVAPEKPVYVKAELAYDPDAEEAKRLAADQWLSNCLPGPVTQELRRPEQYGALADQLSTDEITDHVMVSSDLDRHIEWLSGLAELDVETLIVHNVTPKQKQFIETFGESVLPALR